MTFCKRMVTSVRNILGKTKSSMLLAVVDGLSKGKPMLRLSGYSLSFKPQKLDASTQLNVEPSGLFTCKLVIEYRYSSWYFR